MILRVSACGVMQRSVHQQYHEQRTLEEGDIAPKSRHESAARLLFVFWQAGG